MGTRNLTIVYLDGEYKVAQYGQWDGYPEGQGMTALRFLREEMDEEKFKLAVRNSSFIDPEDLRSIYEKYGAGSDGLITLSDADRMKKDYPEFSRDTGADILSIIQSRKNSVRLTNDIGFAADSLFCEWAWLIDFDRGTFECYRGFNDHTPLTPNDRFYFLKSEERDGYHCIRMIREWELSNLPSDEEFLDSFKEVVQ